MRTADEVPCHHAHDCFNGCRYGKGCYVDDLNNAMGGKPWGECRCMTESERLELAIEGMAKAPPIFKPMSPASGAFVPPALTEQRVREIVREEMHREKYGEPAPGSAYDLSKRDA